ncbi:MAG: endonuclease MutS2 [Deltaproteobacteria bacterium]|nr:endonuclease MutS2 [Deltaproteobacteria bacterium]
MTWESLEVLEYQKIKTLLSHFVATEVGRKRVLDLQPLDSVEKVRESQRRIAEMVRILNEDGSPPLQGSRDLKAVFQQLKVQGPALGPEIFLDILASVESAHKCRHYFEERSLASLGVLASRISRLPEIRDAIRNSIGLRGEILDSASFDLADVRDEIRQVGAKIRTRLENMLNSEGLSKAFQERYVTQRNGRYVLPVRADFKGLIKGFVQDESASGQTLFVEPTAVLQDNNRLQSCLRREKREEERILRELTGLAQKHVDALQNNQGILADLDLVLAAARFAIESRASAPQLTDKPLLELRAARHPLLLFNQDGSPRETGTVPIDICLGEKNDTLVISGPNTGGKTVTIKTAGVLLLMARSGLFIPCHPDSRIFLFDKILVDMGDEQSIEENLSTFSSHLTRLKNILEVADGNSLVLLDEAGSGTDPSEGGALAMAILDALRASGAKIVVSTHLNLLKSYAFLNDGVENAAVEFDARTLKPTYRLHYGMPGASNAFSIARLLGLPAVILDKAAGYMGSEERAGYDLVEELNRKKWSVAQELDEARQKNREATIARQQHQALLEKLHEEKDVVLSGLLSEGRNLVRDAEKKLKRLLDDARHKKLDAREAAKLKGELNQVRTDLAFETRSSQAETSAPGAVAPGEILRICDLGKEAEVVAVHGEEVELSLGGKKLRLPLARLEQYSPRRFAGKSKGKNIRSRVVREGFHSEIKLVGRRVDDALPLLERFLDDALLNGLAEVSVVHGVGEGILRRAVRDYLAKEREVKSFFSADPAHGGDNVTIIKLRG